MNSIRRPRKRPRRESVSFRTFGWILVREAALRIGRSYLGVADTPAARHFLARARTDVIRRRCDYLMRLEPARRYYP